MPFSGLFLFVCHFLQNVFFWQTNIIDGSKDKTAGAQLHQRPCDYIENVARTVSLPVLKFLT